MSFLETYLWGLTSILSMMTILWVISVLIKNVSIVDAFWGIAFIIAALSYYFNTQGDSLRSLLILILVFIWGLRLSIYISIRNFGKKEDYRYRKFREDYGPERYWWFSFFQVFLLQGVLAWLVSAPLLAAMYYLPNSPLNGFDFLAMALYTVGFIFEAGGDFQLAQFKKDPANQGKVLQKGLWKYTRHPNYFGDATVWWAFGCFSLAVDQYIPLLGPLLMSFLIVKISGVALLERSLKDAKPQYRSYIERTNAFVPWFPKKHVAKK